MFFMRVPIPPLSRALKLIKTAALAGERLYRPPFFTHRRSDNKTNSKTTFCGEFNSIQICRGVDDGPLKPTIKTRTAIDLIFIWPTYFETGYLPTDLRLRHFKMDETDDVLIGIHSEPLASTRHGHV